MQNCDSSNRSLPRLQCSLQFLLVKETPRNYEGVFTAIVSQCFHIQTHLGFWISHGSKEVVSGLDSGVYVPSYVHAYLCARAGVQFFRVHSVCIVPCIVPPVLVLYRQSGSRTRKCRISAPEEPMNYAIITLLQSTEKRQHGTRRGRDFPPGSLFLLYNHGIQYSQLRVDILQQLHHMRQLASHCILV